MPRESRLLRITLGISLAIAVCSFTPPRFAATRFDRGTHDGFRTRLDATVPAKPAKSSALEYECDLESGNCSMRPKGSEKDWEVHKFGGASLATADLYKTVGDLIITESLGRGDGAIPTMAIVSARGGMTDLLVKAVDSALVDFGEAKICVEEAVETQISLLKELAPPEITDPIEARFRSDGEDIISVVQSLRMLNTVPAVTMEVVTGFGEIWSAQTLHAYLQTKDVPCDWIDARSVLLVESDSAGLGEKGSSASTGGVTPLYKETGNRMINWWNEKGAANGFLELDNSKTAPIVIVTGFVATTLDGVPTTLKRSGSDFSATIFAKVMGASRVTMWKNTNGVYTADPRAVPEAFPIESLKYDEAMELAYFGAQVLHPSAMEPCIDDQIPVYVRNIFNPSFEGTVIQGRSPSLKEAMIGAKIKNWRSIDGDVPIKGITSVDKTSLVTLEGASMGGAEVAERFMGAMSDNNINVLIITQASSESSITVAVPESEGKRALAALEDAFELELSRSKVNSLSVADGMAIIAIVGEGMALTTGVSSTFMSSLAKANVNIRLIAQGSSERQVAVVVNGKDVKRALRAAHMAFTLSESTASIALLGASGETGTALMKQMEEQKQMLAEELRVAMCVNVATSSDKIAIAENGCVLDAEAVSELLEDEKSPKFDLDKITEALEADVNPLRVIIDCTNSEEVSEYYKEWLSSGINVISPSRKIASGSLELYRDVCKASRENAVSWLYESSVGSALPILTTLQDLKETGDKVKCIKGCVSGTMAFILSTFSEELPFSEAVRNCNIESIPEADVRIDLSGADTARKVVILAREMGVCINLEDVEVESLIPEDLINKSYDVGKDELNDAIIEDIKKSVDASMLERLKAAREKGCELRYRFLIDQETGKCKCALEDIDNKDPLYRLKLNENLVAFETQRYQSSPLIVKGAAAGPDLAAAGIFADILRLTRAYSSNQG